MENSGISSTPKGVPTKDWTESRDAPIGIVPYDPEWPDRFESERVLLAAALAPWLAGPIEHVGSTAVLGLAAKPIIDIMAAVESLDASRDAIPAAESLEYNYWPYKAESMHWFCKPSPTCRTHHLHLVPHQSWLWNARLCFRDALRSDQVLAGDYSALKQYLAQKHRNDREAYTRAKSEFIAEVLAANGVQPGGPAGGRGDHYR